MAKELPQPEPPLDPVEALVHIRTILEASADRLYGTPAEPMVREIRNLLDKALPPRRTGRPTKQ